MATNEHERYDCVFLTEFNDSDRWAASLVLGVNETESAVGESEPKILEYKMDLDGLIADFENEKKYPKDADLLVCWSMRVYYKDSFTLASFLYDEEGSIRSFFWVNTCLI